MRSHVSTLASLFGCGTFENLCSMQFSLPSKAGNKQRTHHVSVQLAKEWKRKLQGTGEENVVLTRAVVKPVPDVKSVVTSTSDESLQNCDAFGKNIISCLSTCRYRYCGRVYFSLYFSCTSSTSFQFIRCSRDISTSEHSGTEVLFTKFFDSVALSQSLDLRLPLCSVQCLLSSRTCRNLVEPTSPVFCFLTVFGRRQLRYNTPLFISLLEKETLLNNNFVMYIYDLYDLMLI